MYAQSCVGRQVLRLATSTPDDPVSARLCVVFIAAFSDEVTSPYDEALRRWVAAGDRTPEILTDDQR